MYYVLYRTVPSALLPPPPSSGVFPTVPPTRVGLRPGLGFQPGRSIAIGGLGGVLSNARRSGGLTSFVWEVGMGLCRPRRRYDALDLPTLCLPCLLGISVIGERLRRSIGPSLGVRQQTAAFPLYPFSLTYRAIVLRGRVRPPGEEREDHPTIPPTRGPADRAAIESWLWL